MIRGGDRTVTVVVTYMGWGKKQIGGLVYDLSHLDPFLMDVAPRADSAVPYRVRVSFGCHTFTRKLTLHDQPDLHFRAGKELRCFCTDRHRLSLQLPDMIRYAANGRVYFSELATFLIIESESSANAPYVAFFNAEKAKKQDGYDAAMFVTSAYLKPSLPDKLPAVTLATLIDYRVRGKPLKRPEPRKIMMVKRK
jgi:hypothetical protein